MRRTLIINTILLIIIVLLAIFINVNYTHNINTSSHQIHDANSVNDINTDNQSFQLSYNEDYNSSKESDSYTVDQNIITNNSKILLNASNNYDNYWKVLLPFGKPAINAKVYAIEVNDDIRNDFLLSEDHFNYDFNYFETNTDDYGFFSFNNLKSSQYLIHAELKGFSSAHTTISFVANFPEKLEIYLGIGKTIAGKVVDINDNAIPGIPVEVSLPYLPFDNLFSMNVGDAVDLVRFHGYCITDNKGCFSIPNQPCELLYFTIELPDSSNYCSLLKTINKYDYSNHIIVLKNKCVISGKVINQEGKPIENAVIWDLYHSGENEESGNESSISDSSGKYMINNAKEGSAFLHCKHSEYASEGKLINVISNNNNMCNFTLLKGIKKKIIVNDDHNNSLSGINIGSQDLTNGTLLLNGTTDDNGACTINSILPGHILAIVVNNDYKYNKLPVVYTEIVKDSKDIELSLSDLVKMIINVYDNNGNKLDNFYASLTVSKSINKEIIDIKYKNFDKNYMGTASWQCKKGCSYSFTILAKGYSPFTYSGFIDENTNNEIVHNIRLKSGRTIEGYIFDYVTKKPINNVEIIPILLSKKTSNSLITFPSEFTSFSNEIGYFKLFDLPNINYSLRIFSPFYAPIIINSDTINFNNINNFYLSKGSYLKGRFISDSLKYVSTGVVEVFLQNGEFICSASSSIDGKFIINNLPSGNLIVKAYDSFLTQRKHILTKHIKIITISEGEGKSIDFVFSGKSIVMGKCFLDNDILSEVKIIVSKIDDGNNNCYETYSEQSGSYLIGYLPAGEYKITAEPTIDGVGSVFTKKITIGEDYINELDIVFNKSSIEGKVIDKGSSPIYGCWLTLINEETSEAVKAFTDINGQYKFYNISPGSYQINTIALGYAIESRKLSVSTDEKQIANFIVNNEGILRLLITDKSGDHLPNTSSYIIDPINYNGEIIKNTNGLFVFKNLCVGKVSAIAYANNFAPSYVTVGISENEIIDKSIQLDIGGTININSRFINGNPASGIYIDVENLSIPNSSWTNMINKGFIKSVPTSFKTDLNGNLSISNLPLGDYSIKAYQDSLSWSDILSINSSTPININISI